MKKQEERDLVQSRLQGDVLRHIVTLKMLRLFGGVIDLRFAQDAQGWALLTLLPVRVSDFDRRTYPDAESVALVDGTSDTLKERLLEGLPRVRLVIKTYDESVRQFALNRLRASKARSYISFSRPGGANPGAEPSGIVESGTLVPEIARMLAKNGYFAEELAGHFSAGARWFAVREGEANISAGFVFPNFEPVWEIGGLYTEPDRRRQGHARSVVAAALGHLAARGSIPRYQVRSDNVESIRLAEAAGLQEFLRMDHFLADPG